MECPHPVQTDDSLYLDRRFHHGDGGSDYRFRSAVSRASGMNRFALPLIAVLIMIPILILGLRSDPSELPSQYIGKPAPDFELPTLKDASITLKTSDMTGQPALVNIWATWCGGCRAEHGFLMELSRENTIPIYAVNWRDNRPEALQWLKQLGDPYVASAFDEDGRVGIDWGVYGAPETFLLNSAGEVVYRFTGPLNRTLWQQEFVPRIAELRQ
jgi:cytochrome c biogenesis protein CcmG/thiol:disulfide interchange protein DsbE